MSDSNIPKEVQDDIAAGVAAVNEEIAAIEHIDPNYNRILGTLEEVQKNIDEERAQADGYYFDRDEFVAALPHIVADQLSAIKKEKLAPKEFAERFNRWFVFCDAVCNLGISCVKNKEALAKQEYESVFRSLKVNKQFENTFLKPHDIRVEFAFKSRTIKEQYKWLAMPCLIVTDEEGTEHKIAITPSPTGSVWWLDILSGFHATYQWTNELLMDQEDYDAAPYPAFGDGIVLRDPVEQEPEVPASEEKAVVAEPAIQPEAVSAATTSKPQGIFGKLLAGIKRLANWLVGAN
ncbi:hypothetical protein [Ralstonia phage RP31]|uniref:Uncharacterized protein n=2 Tax=Ripduovirus RP12 TaxID=2560700 RepID=A0A1L7N0W1_9CAUD|nr:hypothetical protein FDH28_gp289 [Ralstonia phage RP12]BAW19106.1 hypothetical protein [Ralstonia phage RP12]BAW19392.1 hypothetical protein [Ralstonia phage RP31]